MDRKAMDTPDAGRSAVDEIRTLLARIPRRQRLALAAQFLLDEAEGCDQQLGILLKALARDEDGGERGADNPEPIHVRLSPRRQETLGHLMLGLSEKEVAHRMKLTRATVHEHVKRIYRAMGVHSRSELLSMVLLPTDANSRIPPLG